MSEHVWKLYSGGIYVTTYHGVELRCRWTKTGWIVSRRDGDGWLGLTGDVEAGGTPRRRCSRWWTGEREAMRRSGARTRRRRDKGHGPGLADPRGS